MNRKVTLDQVVSKYSIKKLDKFAHSSKSDDCEEGMIITDSDEEEEVFRNLLDWRSCTSNQEEEVLKIVIKNPSEGSNGS